MNPSSSDLEVQKEIINISSFRKRQLSGQVNTCWHQAQGAGGRSEGGFLPARAYGSVRRQCSGGARSVLSRGSRGRRGLLSRAGLSLVQVGVGGVSPNLAFLLSFEGRWRV